MSDLISRQDAIKILTSMMRDCFPEAEEELDAVVTTVREIPSAEPERTEKIHDDKIYPVIHYCGKDIVTLINPTWNYCPCCGKKLEWI